MPYMYCIHISPKASGWPSKYSVKGVMVAILVVASCTAMQSLHVHAEREKNLGSEFEGEHGLYFPWELV